MARKSKPPTNMEFADIAGTELKAPASLSGPGRSGAGCGAALMKAESVATIQAAIEQGIILVDTAPVYGFGRSEEIVGKAIAEAGLRSHAVIATKCGLEWRDGKVFRNSSGERIVREAENSLRRLRTDHIDIYQVHWPDPLVAIEETAEAMHGLYKQGKIGAIGVSNYSVAQMERFRSAAPLHVLQPPYNLFERAIEVDVLPYCLKNNISMLGYGALCRGLLSGKMRLDTAFSGDDLRKTDPKFQKPRFAQYLAAVQRLDQLAQNRYGKRVIHLAVRWMLDQGVTVALWGARHPDQLQPAADVVGWSLNASDKAAINSILRETITDPIGPEFMAPPARSESPSSRRTANVSS